jgi:hypothetical protein
MNPPTVQGDVAYHQNGGSSRSGRRGALIGIGALAVAMLALGLILLMNGGSSKPQAAAPPAAAAHAAPVVATPVVGLVKAADARHVVLRTNSGKLMTFLVAAQYHVDVAHLVSDHIPHHVVTTVHYEIFNGGNWITSYDG